MIVNLKSVPAVCHAVLGFPWLKAKKNAEKMYSHTTQYLCSTLSFGFRNTVHASISDFRRRPCWSCPKHSIVPCLHNFSSFPLRQPNQHQIKRNQVPPAKYNLQNSKLLRHPMARPRSRIREQKNGHSHKSGRSHNPPAAVPLHHILLSPSARTEPNPCIPENSSSLHNRHFCCPPPCKTHQRIRNRHPLIYSPTNSSPHIRSTIFSRR